MRWMVWLYPRAWRARYGVEFAALLDDIRPTMRAALDVALRAFDAHVHPGLIDGRLLLMNTRLRKAEFTILWSFAAFIVAGMYLNGMTDDTPLPVAIHTHAALAIPWTMLEVFSVVAILAAAVGGLPLMLAVLRKALAEQRRDVLLRLAMPLVSAAATLIFVLIVVTLINGRPVSDTVNHILGFTGIVVLFIGSAILSTWGVTSAVRLSEIDGQPMRFAAIPAAVVSASMFVMLAATVVWGVACYLTVPEMFVTTTYGLLGLVPTPAQWLASTLVMLWATGGAVSAARQALRERNVSEPA